MRRQSLCRLAALIVLFPAGCTTTAESESSSLDLDEPADVGTESSAIAAEVPGKAVIVARAYNDPEVTKVSYAAPALTNASGAMYCSGTMVGPNFMMTASHCGGADSQITFRTYRNGDPMTSDKEDYSCKFLLSTWCDTDFALYYCPPNAAGESPGDKYGYLDFDLAPLTVGEPLYSVWSNNVADKGLADARLYSTGTVQGLNGPGWFSPDPSNLVVSTSLYSNGGASGSSQVNPATGRIAVGPQSTGMSEAPGRYALSMRDYLWYGSVNYNPAVCNPTSPLGSANITPFGLDPNNYNGYIDEDIDWLVDLQLDIERLRGENARPWYWLGFESERRNALWEKTYWASFDPANRWLRMTRTGTGTAFAARHTTLNLAAATQYRVSASVYTYSASSANSLGIRLLSGGALVGQQNLQTSAGAGWQTTVFTVTTTAANPELRIEANGNFDGMIADLSVIADTAAMNFDSADKRISWKNDNTGARANILPDGRPTGAPNWAGQVRRDFSRTAGNDWPLRNKQLALTPNHNHMVCFDSKSALPAPLAGNWGVTRVLSGGSEVVRTAFAPGNGGWQTACTAVFYTASSDNNVMFGLNANGDGQTPNYLIDNVMVYTW